MEGDWQEKGMPGQEPSTKVNLQFMYKKRCILFVKLDTADIKKY